MAPLPRFRTRGVLGCAPPPGAPHGHDNRRSFSRFAATSARPSVLVVLVTRDAVAWLRGCLESLAAQTHPRLGVVAVDNGSTDGTLELLRQALGEARVVALGDNRGIAGALTAATELPAAQAADYLLLVHDDAALAPDAVERLLEAAEGIKGVERVGVVGPKIVDWDEPRVLREVGRSTDRFGHPYTPLQDGELDQGQYDRVLEVLFVSSAVMLVSREAWQRTGPFDERYAGHHDDLDFCWRARLAGFRVLMTPLAIARHRDATVPRRARARSSPRTEHPLLRRARRARLDAQGLRRPHAAVAAAGVRRARRSPGCSSWPCRGGSRTRSTCSRPGGGTSSTFPGRSAAGSARSPSDRCADRRIRPFMASTFRLPRWFERAEEFLDEGLEELEDDGARAPAAPPRGLGRGRPPGPARVDPRDRARGARGASLRRARGALGRGARRVPRRPRRLLPRARSRGSARRCSAASSRASPAARGARRRGRGWRSGARRSRRRSCSARCPPLAGIAMYRAMARQTGLAGAAAVVAAAAYVLSATHALGASPRAGSPAWSCSPSCPLAWDRLDAAFARRAPERPFRFGVGLGVGVGDRRGVRARRSSSPVGLFAAVNLVAGRRRDRGLGLVALAAVVGGAARVPRRDRRRRAIPPSALTSDDRDRRTPGRCSGSRPGRDRGRGPLAAFLPIAAIVCFAGAGDPQRGRAWRALVVAVSGTVLAWASVAGYLPAALTNAPAWTRGGRASPRARSSRTGSRPSATGLERQAFGARQLGVGGPGRGAARRHRRAGAPGHVRRVGGAARRAPARVAGDRLERAGDRSASCGSASPDGDPFPAPGGDPICAGRGRRSGPCGSGSPTATAITALDDGPRAFGHRLRRAARCPRPAPRRRHPARRRVARTVRRPVRDRRGGRSPAGRRGTPRPSSSISTVSRPAD